MCNYEILVCSTNDYVTWITNIKWVQSVTSQITCSVIYHKCIPCNKNGFIGVWALPDLALTWHCQLKRSICYINHEWDKAKAKICEMELQREHFPFLIFTMETRCGRNIITRGYWLRESWLISTSSSFSCTLKLYRQTMMFPWLQFLSWSVGQQRQIWWHNLNSSQMWNKFTAHFYN